MLIIFTQGFRYSHNYRQLISFAGLSPGEYSSGTSINGRTKICKKGGKPMCDILYMCAMSAIKTNVACKALYE
ncbi:IS110 family transposase [Ilyomonas limi]|uniref:IS110 family transposase n=1 Tax=Ilyomonas limi TaxID=2575867 RepID=A0A4U3KVS9_9BACT|nr:IS110 family transposase [Ilyomonas limi]